MITFMAFMAKLGLGFVPAWAWKLLGVALLAGVAVWQINAAFDRAYDRGYDKAQLEAAEAAAAATIAMRDQQDKAVEAATERRKATKARLAPIQQQAREYARTASDCPDPAGRGLLEAAIHGADNPAPTGPRK